MVEKLSVDEIEILRQLRAVQVVKLQEAKVVIEQIDKQLNIDNSILV